MTVKSVWPKCNRRREIPNDTYHTAMECPENDTSRIQELGNLLHEKQVSNCCIQENYLNADQTFKIRESQCFISDQKDREKEEYRYLPLKRITFHAHARKSYMGDAEY